MKHVVFTLLVAFFAVCPLHASTISKIHVDIHYPIDPDESEELNIYLASFLQKSSSPENLVNAQKKLLELERYRTATCEYKDESLLLYCKVERIPIIQSIFIRNLPISLLEKDLRKRLPISPGKYLDPKSPSHAEQQRQIQSAVSSFLDRQGYTNAVIQIKTQEIPNQSTVNLIIEINEGHFSMVNHVTSTPTDILKSSKVDFLFKNMCRHFKYVFETLNSPGFSCYSRGKEKEAVQTLKTWLDEKGYPEANISIQRKPTDPSLPTTASACRQKAACLDLEVHIEPGPHVTIEWDLEGAQAIKLSTAGQAFRSFLGVEEISRFLGTSLVGAPLPADETILIHELEKGLTFSAAQIINDAEIQQSIENMKLILAKRGYNQAQIEAEKDVFENDKLHIRFTIHAGAPLFIHSIQFSGNPIYSEEKLLSSVRLVVLPRDQFSSGHFNDEDLQQDQEALRDFYLQQGYPQVQIKAYTSYRPNLGILLDYEILPGTHKTVHSLKIENAVPELTPSILPLLANCQKAKNNPKSSLADPSLCTQSPFVQDQIEDDKERILEVYQTHGYAYASVDSIVQEDETSAHLTFQLNPKEENFRPSMAGVLIDGNIKTRRDVILRQIGSGLFVPGVPLMTREQEEGVHKLRRTRLFTNTTLSYQGLKTHDQKIFALLNVAEKPSITIDTSLSFSTDNLFSLGAEFKEANCFGTLLAWDTQLSLGLFLGRQSSLGNTLLWPNIWGSALSLQLTLPLVTYENRLNRTPPERHLSVVTGTAFDWIVSPEFTPYLKYEIRNNQWQQFGLTSAVDTFAHALSSVDGLSDVLKQPNSTQGVLIPGFLYSDLNHPFNPTKGFKLNLSAEISHGIFNAPHSYEMLNAQWVNYLSFGPFTMATQLLVRRAFISSPDANWWVLKYQSDMDTLGGDTSVRGYQLGTVGIYGPLLNSQTGLPVVDQNGKTVEGYHPGNTSFQANAELRFPLIKNLFFGDLNGAVFSDVGWVGTCQGVFQCNNPNTFLDPSGQDPRLGVSVGAGLRYVMPVGPISLDYAVSPIRKADGLFGREARVHLLFGYMF